MSEEKFTKGPWMKSGVRSTSPTYKGHGVGPDSDWIVIVPYNDKDHSECLANAHLIAAAPELYEACTPLAQILERAVEEGADNLTLMITREMAERILLARSKARGEI